MSDGYPFGDGALRHGHRAMSSDDIIEMMGAGVHRMNAARYAYHKVEVHRNAVEVLRGRMDIADARRHYTEAMRVYDGLIEKAGGGAWDEACQREMAKGEAAVDEMVAIGRKGVA